MEHSGCDPEVRENGGLVMELTTAQRGVLTRMSQGVGVIREGGFLHARYYFENQSSPIQPRTMRDLISNSLIEEVDDDSLPSFRVRYQITDVGRSAIVYCGRTG